MVDMARTESQVEAKPRTPATAAPVAPTTPAKPQQVAPPKPPHALAAPTPPRPQVVVTPNRPPIPVGGAGANGTSTSNSAGGAPRIVVEDKEKARALNQAVSQIEKTFGKGSIMRLDEEAYLNIPGISTGALSLDLALGGKGIPRGRIVEVFGPESSGKTTIALTVAANAQKVGGVAAFIDAEHALDPSWARKIGVNIDELLVSQPDSGEQALEICELLVRSNAVDLIVIDSVAALIPKAEIEGEMGDAVVGLQARLMSQAMRKLTGVIARSNCTVIFINQIREKIGVVYGSPETTPGGRALKFYASVRLDIRRTGAIKEGEITVGSRTRARVVKNKVAPPFRDAEFDIMFDEGVSVTGDLLDMASEINVVEKSGAWYSYGQVRLGQGRENSKKFLKENPELYDEIRLATLKKKVPAGGARPAAAVLAGPAEEE
jgi:recombination protein RecA